MDEIKFKKLNKFIYEAGIEKLNTDSAAVIMKHDIFHAIEKIVEERGWEHYEVGTILDNLIMGLAYMYVDMKEGRLMVLRDEEIHRH